MLQKGALGQNGRRFGVLQTKQNTLARHFHVERQVGGPCLQHCQKSRQQIQRALQTNGHDRVPFHPGGSQFLRQKFGPRVKLPIRPALLSTAGRHGIRGAAGLLLDQPAESQGRDRHCRVVPAAWSEHFRGLLGSENLKISEFFVGIPAD